MDFVLAQGETPAMLGGELAGSRAPEDAVAFLLECEPFRSVRFRLEYTVCCPRAVGDLDYVRVDDGRGFDSRSRKPIKVGLPMA